MNELLCVISKLKWLIACVLRRRQWEFLMRWFISMVAIKCTWNQLTIPSNRMRISGSPQLDGDLAKIQWVVIENIVQVDGCIDALGALGALSVAAPRLGTSKHCTTINKSNKILRPEFWANNVTNLYLFIFSFQKVSHPDVVCVRFAGPSLAAFYCCLLWTAHKRCQQTNSFR